MRRFYHLAIVCACVVAGGVGGLAIWLGPDVFPRRLKVKLASELDSLDPGYKNVMCGPASLSVALGRLGVYMAPSEIASKCRVTSYGVALTDLARVASNHRTIGAMIRKLRWEDLQAVEGVAILFVKGDHYVAADPRETSSKTTTTTSIRVYDRDVPARWYSRTELEKIWSGETMVITKRRRPSDVPGDACIDWDACYIDKGILADTAIARYNFSLRNEGRKPLLIKDMQASCGCMHSRLSAKQLAPGESAQIEVDVNLNGKQGYDQQSVVVSTNDPANPVSYLTLASWIPRKQSVSSEAIRLEALPQDGSVGKEFVVADPGFAGMKIRDARFVLRSGSGPVDDLSCSISWEVIGGHAKEVSDRTGYSASPGDYLVRLSLSANNACPVGPFEGDVVVTIETEDSVATPKVNIQGMIVQDVHSIPQMALIALGPDPESVGSAAIQLHSRTNRNITVVKAWSESTDSLGIRPENGWPAGKNSYVVTARIPDLVVGTAPFKGTAKFELDSGSVVSVPVTVFRPPQGVEKAPEKALVKAGKK